MSSSNVRYTASAPHMVVSSVSISDGGFTDTNSAYYLQMYHELFSSTRSVNSQKPENPAPHMSGGTKDDEEEMDSDDEMEELD